MTERIHQDNETLTDGAPLAEATVAVLLMHGRGATARDMLPFTSQIPQDGVAYLMPQASNNTWYPRSGFGPFEANEPYLSSAWDTITEKLQHIINAGIPQEKIVVGGFSQGACLTAEYVARHPGRYGGLIVLSGALMGPPDTPRDYDGSLEKTQIWVGGADQDSWVTEDQLNETSAVLHRMGGRVSTEIHASAEHTIRPTDVRNTARIINMLTA
ncbi:MAG: phospholipase [Chloroflexota bacterium]